MKKLVLKSYDFVILLHQMQASKLRQIMFEVDKVEFQLITVELRLKGPWHMSAKIGGIQTSHQSLVSQ